MGNRKVIIVLTTVVVLALACFPFEQIIAPDWTVTTLDAAHRPMSRITVREVWQQYSLENASHEEDLLTDSNGQVHFPRRTCRSNFVTRFVSCVGAHRRSWGSRKLRSEIAFSRIRKRC
jgi:hypothetical protein